MIIEEVMVQRMQGVKNEKGVWITRHSQTIYVLDEDNITEDSKYWHLTELPQNVRQNAWSRIIFPQKS